MKKYQFVSVHDRYDVDRATRIRCWVGVDGNYYCSHRQVLDANRRACVMNGSYLRCDCGTVVYVCLPDGKIHYIIEG